MKYVLEFVNGNPFWKIQGRNTFLRHIFKPYIYIPVYLIRSIDDLNKFASYKVDTGVESVVRGLANRSLTDSATDESKLCPEFLVCFLLGDVRMY